MTTDGRTTGRWFYAVAGLVVLLVAGVISRFASSDPDGLERVAADRAGQAARDVEGVQRRHAAFLRVDQEDAIVIAGVGHGENPAGVAIEQLAGAETLHRGGATTMRKDR